MLLYGCSFMAWWHSSNTINVNTFNDSTRCLFKAFNRICGVITIMSYFSIRLLSGTFWLSWISPLSPQTSNLLRYVWYIRVCWNTSSAVGTKNTTFIPGTFFLSSESKWFWNYTSQVNNGGSLMSFWNLMSFVRIFSYTPPPNLHININYV